jgi:hypothetical protein
MSTALEAIAGRHSGMEDFGISLVTNLAAGISPVPLSHAEVLEAGQAAGKRISKLLAEIIAKLSQSSRIAGPPLHGGPAFLFAMAGPGHLGGKVNAQ